MKETLKNSLEELMGESLVIYLKKALIKTENFRKRTENFLVEYLEKRAFWRNPKRNS